MISPSVDFINGTQIIKKSKIGRTEIISFGFTKSTKHSSGYGSIMVILKLRWILPKVTGSFRPGPESGVAHQVKQCLLDSVVIVELTSFVLEDWSAREPFTILVIIRIVVFDSAYFVVGAYSSNSKMD